MTMRRYPMAVCVVASSACVANPSAAQTQVGDGSGSLSPAPVASSAAQPPASNNDIIVTGQRPSATSRVDRRVYDVRASRDGIETVNDVLARIPAVTIDPRGAVALRGNPGVKILVNGREVSGGALRGLSAADISQVEIMTNPSAAYSSGGSGGIINIVSKKPSTNGWSGMTNARADGDGRYSGSASATYKSGNFTFSTSTGASAGKTNRSTTSSQEGNDASLATGIISSNEVSSDQNHNLFFNNSVRISMPDRQSLDISLNTNRSKTRSSESTNVISDPSGGNGISYRDQANTSGLDSSTDLSVGWEKEGLRPEQRIAANFDLTRSLGREEVEHLLSYRDPDEYQPPYYQRSRTPESQLESHVDYYGPMERGNQVNAGFYFGVLNSATSYSSSGIATAIRGGRDAAGTYKYSRRAGAAYVTIQRTLGKLVAMPGIRIEAQGWTTANQNEPSAVRSRYLRVLPSLNLAFQISPSMKAVASYSHRTARPEPWQLNAREVYGSPLYLLKGNPHLRLSDTDSFEAGYEYEHGKLSSQGSVYVRNNSGEVATSRDFDQNGTMFVSYFNLERSRSVGVELNAKWKIAQVVEVSANTNVFEAVVGGLVDGQSLQRRALTYSGNAIIEVRPAKRDWLQLTLNVEGRRPTPQGYMTGFSRLDLVYRHRLTRRWTVAVRAFDLTDSSNQKTVFITDNVKYYSTTYTSPAGVNFGLAYRFGGAAK